MSKFGVTSTRGAVRRLTRLLLGGLICLCAALCARGQAGPTALVEPDGRIATSDVANTTQTSAPSTAAVATNAIRKLEAHDPVDFFKRHFYPYEPFYFVAGPDSPNAKFQISFKYQIVDEESALARRAPFVAHLFAAYTQTALWDWNKPSAPFEDSSYKPELMYSHALLARAGSNEWFRLDFQTGLQHESNGRDGADSRSLNIAYLRPTLVFGRADGPQLTLSPRAWVYLGGLDDNPDLADYRGYADLRTVVGWANGVQLASILRVGDDFDRGSVQLDLTYPLNRIPWLGLTWYLHAQYFTGYGESLLHYNERSSTYRFGFSIFR